MSPKQRESFQAALKNLRQHCAKFERGFRGYDQIANYLTQLGVVDGHGGPVTPRTVRSWAERGLPVFTLRKTDKAFTTNLMLLAWMASYRERQRAQPKNLKLNRQPKVPIIHTGEYDK